MFFVILKNIGNFCQAEIATNNGQIDMIVTMGDYIYIFEFKLNGTKDEAIKQIKSKEYYKAYRLSNNKITLIGVH